MPSELICILAFKEPPAHWGFQRSRRGNSWFIRISPARVDRCIAALKDLGIDARVLTPEQPKNNKRRARQRTRNRPRGKTARAAYDAKHQTDRYIQKTESVATAVAKAIVIENDKRARAQREAKKMRAEKQKQAAQLRKRDQLRRAAEAAAIALLENPAGTA